MQTIKRNTLQALLLGGCALIIPGYALAQNASASDPVREQAIAPAVASTSPTRMSPAVQEEQAEDFSTPKSEPQKEEVQTLKSIVVSAGVTYRSHVPIPAPVLVYSSKFFAKFEPISVGQQLRRVPGVAFEGDIGEAVKPEMRGLGHGYTQVLINGRSVPGMGNDRSVAVDRIPAEIVDRIEVIRSPSADMNSNGIGGTINIILKDGATLPSGVILRTGISRDTKTGRMRPNAAISWSGHNAAENVFWSVTGDIQKRFNEKHEIQEVVDGDTLGFADVIARGGDGRSLQSWDNRSQSRATEREVQGDQRDSKDVSFNGDLTWQVSDASTLRFDASLLRTTRYEYEDTYTYAGDGTVGGLDLANPERDFEKTPIDQDSNLLSVTFYTSFGDLTDFTAYLGHSLTKGTETKNYFEPTPDIQVKRKRSNATDKNWAADAAVTRRMPDVASSLGILGASLKVGVQANRKNRTYLSSETKHIDNNAKMKGSEGQFNYKEDRLNFYAMVDWDLTPTLVLTTGARAEKTRTRQDYVNVTSKSNAVVDTETGDASSHDFMINPSAHLKWSPTNLDQFRFSVARTVRRPIINELIPSVSLESPGDEDVTIGNPNLKIERSLGFDLGYERRLGAQGVVGVNLFRRNLTDLIGLVKSGRPVTDAGQDPADYPGGLFTFQNIGDATVSGVELDFSMPLAFMGMRNTGLFGNYARLYSERDNPYTDREVTIDDQPSYVYNIGLTQDVPSWAFSFGASYQKQGAAFQHNSIDEMQTSEYGGNLEVFFEKRFGESFVLRLTGSNLLDSCSFQYEQDFDGDSAAELIANNRAYNVDSIELERECSSPNVALTLRTVF